jgi:hypothetical protein
MKCPICEKELVCRQNGVPLYHDAKDMETYICNGDLWECICGFIFIDGVDDRIMSRPVAVITRK